MVKNPPANAGDQGFSPWVRKTLRRREWQPTPVFLPGESHGQRSPQTNLMDRDRLQSTGSQRSQTRLRDSATTNNIKMTD